MKQSKSGFTIVELIVAIVVIAILAALILVNYNNLTQRAFNTQQQNDIGNWIDAFKLYKANKTVYPEVSTADGTVFCLGINFPQGYGNAARCQAYTIQTSSTLQSTNAQLLTDLSSVTDLPNQLPTVVKTSRSAVVGPYVVYYLNSSPAHFEFHDYFKGDSSACPSNWTLTSNDNAGAVDCYTTLQATN